MRSAELMLWRIIGVLLILVGLVVFASPHISYNARETLPHTNVSVKRTKTFIIPHALAVLIVIAGVAAILVPISRFGIGLIAVFLIADVLEVCTRSSHSPRHDEVQRRLRIEKLGSLAFVTEHRSDQAGTVMRLRLRAEYNEDFVTFEAQVANYLQRTIVRPRIPITVRLPNTEFTLLRKMGFKLKRNGHERFLAWGLEIVMLDIERWSDRLSGTVGLVFSKRSDGRLSHLHEGRYVRFLLVLLCYKLLSDMEIAPPAVL